MSAPSARDPGLRGTVRYAQGPAALIVNRAWCKGCDICVEACPIGILELDESDLVRVTDMSRCIFCGICAARCPDFVFTLDRPWLGSTPSGAAANGGRGCG